MKADFAIVKTLYNLSGFGWDDGMQTITAQDHVWDAYILVG
jgi:hypothetical protein